MIDVKKRILIGLALAHFMVIIIYNILSLADAVTVIYGSGQRAEDDSSALCALRKSIHFLPVQTYARFSGAETGFAFFAPQVGSQYITIFMCMMMTTNCSEAIENRSSSDKKACTVMPPS